MSAADRFVRGGGEGGAERTLVEATVVEHTLADEPPAVERTRPTRRVPISDDSDGWGSHPADIVEPATRPRILVEEAAKRELDLDQIQELAWSVVGAVLYLLGIIASAIALTMAFSGWVGTLLILIAGAIPAFYTLRKSAQRRAEKERHARNLAAQEQSAGTISLPGDDF